MRKIEAIEDYLTIIESSKQTNCIYYEKLLGQISNILERVVAFNQGSQEKTSKYFPIILEKSPKIIEMIFLTLSQEKHKNYHENLSTLLKKVSVILRNYHICLSEEIAYFLIQSENMMNQNEGLTLLKSLSGNNELIKREDLNKIKERLEDMSKQMNPKPLVPLDSKELTFKDVSNSLKKEMIRNNLDLFSVFSRNIENQRNLQVSKINSNNKNEH